MLDWADGCQYQGEFRGTARHGRGRVRFDTDPSQKKADEVVQVRTRGEGGCGVSALRRRSSENANPYPPPPFGAVAERGCTLPARDVAKRTPHQLP